MAQTIRCDYTDCPEVADFLISNLQNGDTMAWCGPHYLEAVVAQAEAITQAEADRTDDDATTRLDEVEALAQDDEAELTDAAVAARLDTLAPPAETAPAHTVRRGQSRKAREHQDRQERPEGDNPALTVQAEREPDDDEDDDEPEAIPAGSGEAPAAVEGD